MVERLLDTGLLANSPALELHEAMRLAASAGSLETVKLFIDRGAPVDPPEALYPIHRYSMELEHETTPLLAAAGTCQVKILRLLLERGADPNLSSLPDKAGPTALYLARRMRNFYEAVDLLLLHGADINSQGPLGTPLHLASRFGDVDRIKYLLGKGATIDACNEWRQTPLHSAVSEGRVAILTYLLHAGAKPNAQT